MERLSSSNRRLVSSRAWIAAWVLLLRDDRKASSWSRWVESDEKDEERDGRREELGFDEELAERMAVREVRVSFIEERFGE